MGDGCVGGGGWVTSRGLTAGRKQIGQTESFPPDMHTEWRKKDWTTVFVETAAGIAVFRVHVPSVILKRHSRHCCSLHPPRQGTYGTESGQAPRAERGMCGCQGVGAVEGGGGMYLNYLSTCRNLKPTLC
ncbi:hypothetical protein BaRGS_00024781 [Batillaria attramentaria]|uniref:Uncharacterized protein n=1 Tax=Batillaria attramentaria TaxID=370345 RepID=A0ABD0K9Z6_9CAEN